MARELCEKSFQLIACPEVRVEAGGVYDVVAVLAARNRGENGRYVEGLDTQLVEKRDLCSGTRESDAGQLHPVSGAKQFLAHSLGRSLCRRRRTEWEVKLTTSFRTCRDHGPGWAVFRISSQRPRSSSFGRLYEARAPARVQQQQQRVAGGRAAPDVDLVGSLAQQEHADAALVGTGPVLVGHLCTIGANPSTSLVCKPAEGTCP